MCNTLFLPIRVAQGKKFAAKTVTEITSNHWKSFIAQGERTQEASADAQASKGAGSPVSTTGR